MATAAAILELFAERGVTHVVGIPDNGSAALFDALESEPRIEHLIVTREGEAFAIAGGLWIGGRRPVVLIQNTGLLESGDALRGTVMRMGMPLLLLVGYRGFAKMRDAGLDPQNLTLDRTLLTRPDVDSVALLTEPTLDAWGIPYRTQSWTDGPAAIREAMDQAERESVTAAVLLTGALS